MLSYSDVDVPRGRIAPWLAAPLRKNRAIYTRVALAAIMINVFSLITSLFTMTVYDRVVPNNATDSLIGLTVGLVLILLFDFALKLLRAYFVDVAGARIDRDIGKSIFQQILDMRLDLGRSSTGGLAGLVREIETLRDFFASATLTALVDLPFIFITLAVIALIGGNIVWVPIVLIPIVVVTALISQPVMQKLSAETLGEALGKQAVLVETIGSLETVKSANAGGMLSERWDKAVMGHAGVSLRQRLISTISINMAGTMQTMAYTGVVIFGVYAIQARTLTMGGLIACSILAGRAVAPLATIAQLLTRINSARTAYRQIDKMMSQPPEGPAGEGIQLHNVTGGIEFREVDFRYPNAPELALTKVSFRINPGEHVALIGPIGSGKSTIARLIIGLYPPTSGLVMIDGTDIRQFSPPSLRAKVGALFQDNVLLTGTIRDNIILGRDDVDEAEMLRASEVSGAHDFISQLPNGYDLRLHDRGEGLSGGQRQSIAMARALIGRPPILVLDEPTSSVDTETEARLIHRLKNEFAGRTLILITHRPSLLNLADRVIVMARGRVAMDGPTSEVLRQVTRPRPSPQIAKV
ncbi:ATP-binding cassette subfamily C protein LapB [Novosphingobium kunmingense]|uniref:ATP-binding cassette subfamily C protein LapB n=1 Tax=Novosphingobium kunmingense TaxID=1211806 RepID=A0A2N0I3F4_9SPHN|nr:type I secretion system permease/ATPase [Novosphingobium kunmingense]PKB25716.1 ATP-binding cassette subfamily C protein LapB [Novosphingobium kunmingense]